MTPEEFNLKEKELLQKIPPEFRSAFSYLAYEEHHSAGHEEILNGLRGMIYDLGPSIENFEKRIRKECE